MKDSESCRNHWFVFVRVPNEKERVEGVTYLCSEWEWWHYESQIRVLNERDGGRYHGIVIRKEQMVRSTNNFFEWEKRLLVGVTYSCFKRERWRYESRILFRMKERVVWVMDSCSKLEACWYESRILFRMRERVVGVTDSCLKDKLGGRSHGFVMQIREMALGVSCCLLKGKVLVHFCH